MPAEKFILNNPFHLLGKLDQSNQNRVVEAATNSVIIWDFDGVIADTEPLHRNTYKKLLQAMGNDVTSFDFRSYIGRTEPEIWEMISTDGYKLTLPLRDLMAAREDAFVSYAIANLAPSHAFIKIIGLVQSVCTRQVVVSNGSPKLITQLLNFWKVEGLEQLSPINHPGKKLGLLKELWNASRTVTIEDNSTYLRMAGFANSWRIAVHHSLNKVEQSDGELHVDINLV